MAKRHKRKKNPPGHRVKPKGQVTLAGMNGPEAASNWDHGPNTARARARTVVEKRPTRDPETGELKNPNGVDGVSRYDVVWFYWKRDLITDRQFKAAEALIAAWEKTMRSPPAINPVQVDHSPKPDQHISVLLDRIGGYHAVAKHISKQAMPYLEYVVMENRHITGMPGYRKGVYMNRLRKGLDELADNLGVD